MMLYLTFLICAMLSVSSESKLHPTRLVFDLKDDTLKNITFYLYTRSNAENSMTLENGSVEALKNSSLDMAKPIKILLHGYMGTYDGMTDIKSGFLIAEDCAVISVDWQDSAAGEYEDVAGRVPHVSVIVASFIDWLNQEGIPFENFHLVGFSMGGQVAGFIGRNLKRGRLNYITVLDPADRIWVDRDDATNKRDGNYVEVIHTNTHHLGMKFPLGHVDFYPNGGVVMAGCKGNDGCSHMRAVQYFAETLGFGNGSHTFTGQHCTSYEMMENELCDDSDTAIMGGIKVKNITGIYYLKTNEESPFSKG